RRPLGLAARPSVLDPGRCGRRRSRPGVRRLGLGRRLRRLGRLDLGERLRLVLPVLLTLTPASLAASGRGEAMLPPPPPPRPPLARNRLFSHPAQSDAR